MQNFAGLGSGSDDRVVAELFGVPVRGALFLFSVNLRDGRVDIDHERLTGAWSGAESPDALQYTVGDGVELADVTERECS